jgi:hypothetical protein
MALTTSIPSRIGKQGLFFCLLHIQSQKGKKLKTLWHNNTVIHRVNIVRPIKGANTKLVRGCLAAKEEVF